MASQEHLDILKQGVEVWNRWRKEHTDIHPDLFGVDFSEANLNGADLSHADLHNASLQDAKLIRADLRRANLNYASLAGATLSFANFIFADLYQADFSFANVSGATLSGATLSGATLSRATLVQTNLTRATLTQCFIYGISVWSVELEGAKQDNLVITQKSEPTITVDNLEVAQFIYLLLNNPKIRDVIDTIAKKAVLILGRFTPERKAVLDAMREALRTVGTYLFCLTLKNRAAGILPKQ